MVDNIQPLQDRVQIVNANGTPTPFFIRWAKQRQIDISEGITAAQAQQLIEDWAAARDVTAGVGLDGGGNLSADITINLEDTAVTPGVYGDASNIPQITVDQQGRITDIVDIPAAGGGGSLEIEDEGVSVETGVTKINFTGAGVTATSPAAGEVDVDIPGGGGDWTLIDQAGAPISAGTTWTFSVAVANVDIVGLAGYNDLLIVCRGITLSVSGTIGLRASTDNGATFFGTAGNYINVATTGVESNSSFFANNGTNATAARSLTAEINAINVVGPKHCRFSGLTVPRIFVADNANDIDAIRIIPSGGGNMTGGSISVYAR